MGRPHLLERAAELDGVRGLVESAQWGAGRALVLEGPGGIGKTAVLDEAVRLAAQSGIRSSAATGSELESDYAFGTVRDLLGGLVAEVTKADRTELFAGAASPAAAVLGIRLAPADLPPFPEDPAAVLHGLYWLVANLAEHGPLLLVADDLQWCDRPSQRFLAYLSRRLGDLSVSLLMATRPVDPDIEVVAGVLADHRVPILSPAPLSVNAVGEVIARRWADAADETFVMACHEAAGGNPFLTQQLLRALHDADMGPTGEAAAVMLAVGSEGARRPVLQRLARLPSSSVEVVRAVAVLGPDATIHQIALIAEGVDERAIADALEALDAAGLVVADQPVRFVHPLVRTAIYDDMAPALRTWWHTRAARALSDDSAATDRVAAHLMHVAPDASPWAAGVLCEAAEVANRQGAPDAAASLYRRALAEPPPASQRHSLLLRLGDAERAAGEPEAVEHLIQAFAAAGTPGERIAAAWPLSTTLVTVRRGDEAVAMLEQLHDEIEDEQTRLTLQAAIVQAGFTTPLAAPRALPRIHALARVARSADPEAIPPGVAALAACAAWSQNQPAERVAVLVGSAFESHGLADRPIPPWAAALAIVSVGTEHADASVISDRFVSLSIRQGDLPRSGIASAIRSLLRLRRGALVASAGDADAAIDACTMSRLRTFIPLAIATRIYGQIDRGENEAAHSLIEHLGCAGSLDDLSIFNSHLAHARALLHMAEGRTEEAIADLRDAGRRLEISAFITPSFVPWRSDLALALHAHGQAAEAEALAAEELELARAFGRPRCVGMALRAVALVGGDRVSAEQTLRDAVTTLTDREAPVELARALLDLGSMVRRRGARTEAREPLTRSLDLASGCGALALAERARAELVVAGARPRRSRTVGIDSLTVTEARTVELAANGSTNKQIAQTMFVGVKTVETHLAHAYQKLGVARRGDLAGALSAK